MKKITIALIIFISFLPFINQKSDYKDITNVVYVSSIGLDYNQEANEYTVYFYILNNLNLGNAQISSSNIEDLSYTVKVSSDRLAKAITSILKKTNIGFYFTHLQTMIITNDFFNKISLKELYDFVKGFNQMFYDFFIFATDSKITDLYNIENFSDVTAYHTILVNPSIIKNYKLITFVDFCKAYLNPHYTLLIPHLTSLQDEFYHKDENYYYLEFDGYSLLQKDLRIKTFLSTDYDIIKWLLNLADQHLIIDEYELYIKNGSYKIKKTAHKIQINYYLSAVLDLNPHYETFDIIQKKLTKLIQQEISKETKFFYDEEIDLFNLKYLLNSSNLNFDQIEVNVSLILN